MGVRSERSGTLGFGSEQARSGESVRSARRKLVPFLQLPHADLTSPSSENPRVDGSIPSLATISNSMIRNGFRVSPADRLWPSMADPRTIGTRVGGEPAGRGAGDLGTWEAGRLGSFSRGWSSMPDTAARVRRRTAQRGATREPNRADPGAADRAIASDASTASGRTASRRTCRSTRAWRVACGRALANRDLRFPTSAPRLP